MSYTYQFNTMMEQFIEDLERVFPEEKKISAYRNSFYLFKKINTKKPAQRFYENFYLYSKYILSRDDSIIYQDDIEIIHDS